MSGVKDIFKPPKAPDDSAVKADLKRRNAELRAREAADQRRRAGGLFEFIGTGPLGRSTGTGARGLSDVLGV